MQKLEGRINYQILGVKGLNAFDCHLKVLRDNDLTFSIVTYA